MFGKWHLGDNYPFRPQDRGFDTVVAHKGGGVGQTPDFWGNNYFDDTYFANGTPSDYTGYCTDVWFEQATAFIEDCGDEPFFAYIATNAPHGPFLVEDRYADPYRGNDAIPNPEFYGMITNIDENFGRLREMLAARGIEDDTILMFMTDNGSSAGCRLDEQGFVTGGYNAGMRGMKNSRYDGGHRTPWFMRWPAAGVSGGRDIPEMSLHVDVLPTLIDLCGLEEPAGVEFDGQSLRALVRDEADRLPGDRVHHIDLRQSTELPDIWDGCVMTRDWRLVRGRELYAIQADPGQRSDVAAEHPGVVQRLRDAQEAWWQEILPRMREYAPISLGAPEENPTRLDSMDVHGDVAWNQGHIAMAQRASGQWAVKVERSGRYRFGLRRWPEELDLPIDAGISQDAADALAPFVKQLTPRTIAPVRARLSVGERHAEAKVRAGDIAAVLELDLEATEVCLMDAWFVDASGEEQGAYYVYVEYLDT
jgi:hypothetical protein